MLVISIPEVWPPEFSSQVKIIHATCNFNSELAIGINNVADLRISFPSLRPVSYVDVRVLFPSLDSENQCRTIKEHIRERGDISLSQVSSFTDNTGELRYRLTIEYSTELLWEIEI